MPDGRSVNPEGLDFYDRLVDGMLERGLKPAATLYHWEMPSALNDLGGWRNRDVAQWFGCFTEAVMARIGDRVWSAAPINEPWCVGWLSHFMGVHAPGLRDIRATARAMHHVLLAHGTSIAAMRALGVKNLGAVCNFEYPQPVDDSAEAARAAATYDAFYNRFFLEGLFRGAYPEEALEGLAPHLPEGWQDDFTTIAAPLDWVGINYYTRKILAPAPRPWPSLSEIPGPLPKTMLGWEVYPEGLRHFLHRVARETGGLPIYVTENGMASPDVVSNGICDDQDRITYIDGHVAAVRAALSEGVPVKGYFVWSLMDNYEWAMGYDPRFGLVHVDFDTMIRTPKASWHGLAAALGGKGAQ
jgi:beta-glucosidase